eukprot:CAMPEP_0201526842 /NCGR_PEP_ID=MMETSP0161_2-20130828/33139_1 /ASSEMBLY_ACC=CAM_ASM_000251 /TAXON_ID=180227 /ORGANISM="Neoparamoeba aestuarina, Strain SoJaBio B1-5/56/2" /LENGTH=411 /DNA_ID=CAMNT_0047927399 /DNA_START=24 /DNA_END=1256 /DNA_ORIENTATION=+
MSVLIIGAAGAVGKKLVRALASRGEAVVASDRMSKLPRNIQQIAAATEPNVDVRDVENLRRLFEKYPDVKTVWNLAAPLSVETAINPKIAEEITIGGMNNVLTVMGETGTRKICFTDSIGSFGKSAPRENCSARWLRENPTQDPGSDYGIQKRGCRELMARFKSEKGGDPRFAVLPGVLHSEALWGSGTTEYALEALQAAATGNEFICPVEPDVKLPMVYVDDLMRGMIALQDAEEAQLHEPDHGYCIPGLAFTAYELFAEIRQHYPHFSYRVELDENINKFANYWPNSLSGEEAARDLNFRPQVALPEMVDNVLAGHEKRRSRASAAFTGADADGNERLDKEELEGLLATFLRLPHHLQSQRPDIIEKLAEDFFEKMDANGDGVICIEDFQNWSKTHSIQDMVADYSRGW